MKTDSMYRALLRAKIVSPIDKLRLRIEELKNEILHQQLSEAVREKKVAQYTRLKEKYLRLTRRRKTRRKPGKRRNT